MITAKKARDLALGELNWWEKWRRNSSEYSAVYNCYDHWYEDLKDTIEITAKKKEWEVVTDLFPNFHSTSITGGSPKLHWFDYTEQINLAQEAVLKLKHKLESKGFRVDFNTTKMNKEEMSELKNRYFHTLGQVDVKFEIIIDWKLI